MGATRLFPRLCFSLAAVRLLLQSAAASKSLYRVARFSAHARGEFMCAQIWTRIGTTTGVAIAGTTHSVASAALSPQMRSEMRPALERAKARQLHPRLLLSCRSPFACFQFDFDRLVRCWSRAPATHRLGTGKLIDLSARSPAPLER